MAALITAFLVAGIGPADPQAGGGGEIVSARSGKVMDVLGASTAAGAPIVQWRAHEGANQEWHLKRFSVVNGLDLVLIVSGDTNRVIDVAAGSTDNGAGLVQAPWAATESQLWLHYPFGDTGYHLLFNVKSGKAADVSGASLNDGAVIVQFNWHGGLNQIWQTPEVEVPVIVTTTTEATTTTTEATTTTTEATTTTTEEPEA